MVTEHMRGWLRRRFGRGNEGGHLGKNTAREKRKNNNNSQQKRSALHKTPPGEFSKYGISLSKMENYVNLENLIVKIIFFSVNWSQMVSI